MNHRGEGDTTDNTVRPITPPAVRIWNRMFTQFGRDLPNMMGQRYANESSSSSIDDSVIPGIMTRREAATYGWFDHCPWFDRKEHIGHGCSPIKRLHEEIEDFFIQMAPSTNEHALRLTIIDEIKEIITRIFGKVDVFVYGSFESGLYLPTSDVDITFIPEIDCGVKNLQLDPLATALRERNFHVCVIRHTRIPVVKLTHKSSKLKFDICYNQAKALKSAEMIKTFCTQMPYLPKLVLVLKQFLLQRELNEVFKGGLGSFGLILLVYSFLQKECKQEDYHEATNLGILLIRFFEFYGKHFNYATTGISVTNDGRYFPKPNTVDITPEAVVNIAAFDSTLRLMIQDPSDENNDVTQASFRICDVRDAFYRAYMTLVKGIEFGGEPKKFSQVYSILGRVIRVTAGLNYYRQKLQDSYKDLLHAAQVKE